MPSFSQSLRSSTSTFRPWLLGQRLGLRQVRGRAVVARAVGTFARQRHAGGDGGPRAGRRPARPTGLVADQAHALPASTAAARWAWCGGRRRSPRWPPATSASAWASVSCGAGGGHGHVPRTAALEQAQARRPAPCAMMRRARFAAGATATRGAFTPATRCRYSAWPALSFRSPASIAACQRLASVGSMSAGSLSPATSSSAATSKARLGGDQGLEVHNPSFTPSGARRAGHALGPPGPPAS
jgi:hypothetical protein